MDVIIKPCNPIQGVSLGQTPTLDLELGPRYRALVLEVIATSVTGKAVTLADVLGKLTLKANGNPQRTHLATELDAVQTAYGAEFAANLYAMDGSGKLVWPLVAPKTAATTPSVVSGQAMVQIVINLAEPWRKSYAAALLFAWYTAWANGSVLRSFQSRC